MTGFTRVDAERALQLATELHEAAKSVPMQVEDLLALIEPSATSLEKLKPPEALDRLKQMDQLNAQKSVNRAIKDLVPAHEERERIENARSDLLGFFERLTKSSREKRKRDAKELGAEMRGILSRWPDSRFRTGVLGIRVETGFRRAMGDSAWLVPVMSDDVHGSEVGESLEIAGFRSDAVSPLAAWFQCPVACPHCWGRLRQRMRAAIEVLQGLEVLGGAPGELMLKKQAALFLGISASQISRWLARKVTPEWAKKDEARFVRLLEGNGGCLIRSRIEELRAWKDQTTHRREPD